MTEGFRVLIVEDDESQRRTLCDLVRDEGFEPIPCADGAAALERAGHEDVSVAVLDQRLPDSSGIELLQRLRQRLGPIRVILHTAYGSFESARDAVNLGAFAYVEKLGDPERLLDEIRRAVDETVAETVWEIEGCLRTITEYAPDPILQLDREGTITFANLNLAGHALEDMIGTTLADLVVKEDRECLAATVDRVFEQGTPQECVLTVVADSGPSYRYACRFGPVVAQNRIVRAIVIARDVTANVHAERVERLIMLLVRNARQAVGVHGRLTVETARVVLDEDDIAHHAGAAAGAYTRITVTDDGDGMSDLQLDHAFEPFFTTRKNGLSGGLGLTEVYALVGEAGGHIDIESEAGAGTTVRIYLPETTDLAAADR